MLEKKKDYKIRAKHRNRKRLRLKILKEKASFRNPDEFYYGMINSVTDGGRVRKRLNEKEKDIIPIANRTRDERMLAETQDSRYVGLKHGTETGRLEEFKKRLHFVSAAELAPRQHIVFVDDEEEMEKVIQKKTEDSKSLKQLSRKAKTTGNHRVNKKVLKHQTQSYRELQQRVDRHEKLKTVLTDMKTEKDLLSKGRRFLVRPADQTTGAPAVFKWQQERRR